ncbi:hypothetical protein [Streptomyces sp. NPDC060031]|uniref:hypothetical protein n=1 Tax=Streptomyces sp. NPDC060031 TaxID=3347043 RepID=UPI0036CFCD1D
MTIPWSPTGGDTGNCDSRLPYRLVDPAHLFFAGTGVVDNQMICARGWTIVCDQRDTPALMIDPVLQRVVRKILSEYLA